MREYTEEKEFRELSQYATFSRESEGREYEEEKCEVRTCFQRDRDRIIHSKAFRRLKHKTQVFIAPEGDHYRTRLTHTLEVSQIARTVARSLRLNEDLTEAIALGHDLGHTPFGHAGDNEPLTLEGAIVRIADRIAYINHDIDDALRAGLIKLSDLPQNALDILGKTHSQRIDTMVSDMINESRGKNKIRGGAQIYEASQKLRKFLFDNIYFGSLAKIEEGKAKRLVKLLYKYYMENPAKIPDEFKNRIGDFSKEQIIIDYIAGMSDRYAIKVGKDIYIPEPWFVK